jgi:hypothetical protein
VEPRQDRDQVFGHGPYRTSARAPNRSGKEPNEDRRVGPHV